MSIKEILNKKVSRKKFLTTLGAGALLLPVASKLVSADWVFRDETAEYRLPDLVNPDMSLYFNKTTDDTDDITDTSTNRFTNDTDISRLSNTSGNNTGDQTITLTGDVTGSGTGSFIATIPNDTVTYEKIQNVTAHTILGRYDAANGDMQEISLGTGLSFSGGVINADQSGSGTATWGGINGDIEDQTDLVSYVATKLKRVIKVSIYNSDLNTQILPGTISYYRVPFNCTIISWYITETSATPSTGSIVLDVWKDTSGNYPPTVADSIAGTEKPTLVTQVQNYDNSLSSWTTALTEGDYLGIKVDSNDSCRRVELQLEVTV